MKNISFIFLTLFLTNLYAADLPETQSVNIQPASEEGKRAMKGFKLDDGLSVNLVAAEPLLANPVAFDIDEKGNFYVVESFRLHKGVTDIRQHMNWLDEELASQSVEDMRKMFHRHKVKGLMDYSDRVRLLVDTNNDGVVTVAEFEENYRKYFVDADDRLPALVARLDPTGSGVIDYIEWSKLVQPEDVPRLVSSCRVLGPLSLSAPTAEDLVALANTKRRLDEVAQVAFDNQVRLLIDAEQTWFQPAIDNFTLELMKKYNSKNRTSVPIIFNTYQCYLKSTPDRIRKDMQLSHRNNFHFAAKLVRGAYMTTERARTIDNNRSGAGAAGGEEEEEKEMKECPIHDTLQDTHDCYNDTVKYLFDARRIGGEANAACEVMLGSHNQESIEKAIAYIEMHCNGDGNRVGAHFAQLLGMRDNLTFALGEAGYNAYKYVPYGLVSEVLPYLIRRAQENSDVTAGMGEELNMIKGEIKRRMFG